MTTYPHYAGVPCQNPAQLSVVPLSFGRSIDVGAVERNYHHAVQTKHLAGVMAHGLALESALVLRHVGWKLRNQGGPVPRDIATVLESLASLHIKADARPAALRRGKSCRPLYTRYVTLVKVLYSLLSEL